MIKVSVFDDKESCLEGSKKLVRFCNQHNLKKKDIIEITQRMGTWYMFYEQK